MIITLDNLANRYNLLPSEALERGTSFDLYVLDISARWSKYQQDQANGVTNPSSPANKEQLLEMLKRTREQAN